jgi:hypothetical protein
MKRVIQGTGAGDPQNLIDQERANALVSENPGWSTKAAYRHADRPEPDERELEANQSIPTPVPAEEEGRLEPVTMTWRENTGHQSS